MKLLWFSLSIVLVLAVVLIRFLLVRQREKNAQAKGVVVYATLLSIEPETFLGKPSPVFKLTMWLQEPGATERRNVTLSSRIPAGQKIEPGVMLPVVIDPKDPKRIYPAGPDAVKRVQLTGSRQMRRQMRSHGL